MKKIKQNWKELNAKSFLSKIKELHQLNVLQLQQALIKTATIAAAALILTSCATPPKKFHEISKGSWNAKVLVKDKKRASKVILNAKFQAELNQQLRLDVTSPLGAHVASLVLKQENVEYLLVKERRFYYGKADENSLKPIFSLPLNPEWLFAVLFDQSIKDRNWNCIKDDDFIRECHNLKTKMKVTWLNRRGKKKSVHIEHELAELQMSFEDFDTNIKNEEKTFTLKAPSSFTKIKL